MFEGYWEYSDETFSLSTFFDNVANQDMAVEVMQWIGLTDTTGKDYYTGDISEFENGDRFCLKIEYCMEVYIEWIGDPKCEDQARDLYRISNAKIIGNIHQHSHLLGGNNND